MEQQLETQPKPSASLFTLSRFQRLLDQYLSEAKKVNDIDSLKHLITDEFVTLLDSFLAIGQHKALSGVSTFNKDEIIAKYLTHFILPKQFKALVILHRDSLVQIARLPLFSRRNDFSKEQENEFLKKTNSILQFATQEFEIRIDAERDYLHNQKKVTKFIQKEYGLKNNPWTVYSEQLETLKTQIAIIVDEENQLLVTQSYFDDVKMAFQNLFANNAQLVSHYDSLIQQVLDDLSKEDIQQLSSVIEKKVMGATIIGNDMPAMSIVDDIEMPYNIITTIVSTENGFLHKRTSNLKKDLKKWLDYRIMPQWSELYALEETFKVNAQIQLTSIANGLQVSQEKLTDLSTDEIVDYVKVFRSELFTFESQAKTIIAELMQLLSSGLNVVPFIQGKPFLEVPVQSSFERTQRTALNRVGKKVKIRLENLNKLYSKAKNIDHRNDYELALEAIKKRFSGIESGAYDALFLNRKFMGDLFMVERNIPKAILAKAYQDWNDGFPRATLISGAPLAGKSTFIQNSIPQLFGRNVVKLKPEEDAVVDGRKFKTTYNLGDALTYIKRHNLKSTRLAVIVDDLERWRDAETSVVANVRALLQFIENSSDEFFVLVGCSRMLIRHLENVLPIKSTFTTNIDLSKSTIEEISKAILIRHQSAHKSIIDEKGNKYSPAKTQKLIERLAKEHSYNLGQVLQAWSYTTIGDNKDNIRITEVNDIVDFFTAEERILLKQALLFKTVTERGLQNVTGSGYQNVYRPALKRLLNSRVLMRDLKGYLYIPDFLINDIEAIINKKSSSFNGTL